MSNCNLFFDTLVDRVQILKQKSLDLQKIVSFLQTIRDEMEFFKDQLSVLVEDPQHPYSRTILLNHSNLEMMLARWTPNYPCAPHDHGDSYSAILVLEGCSEHKSYLIQDGELICKDTEYKTRGEIITCPPYQIHSMRAKPDLITLHLYTTSIDDMLVFDMEQKKTFLVDGGSGAWLPDTDTEIVASAAGYLHRESLQQEIL